MTASRAAELAALTDTPKRFLYKVPEAMRLLSMGRSAIYELIRSGRLKSVTEGRSRLIPFWAIDEYLSLLAKEAEVAHGQAS